MSIFAAAAAVVGIWVSVQGGAWQPTPEQIQSLEARLQAYAAEQSALQHEQLQGWSRYSFQFQGRSSGGHKSIFISASCEPLPRDATKEFIVVFDGGSCFFQVIYDLDTKKFRDLRFNGDA